jgi:hypothetical protein
MSDSGLADSVTTLGSLSLCGRGTSLELYYLYNDNPALSCKTNYLRIVIRRLLRVMVCGLMPPYVLNWQEAPKA